MYGFDKNMGFSYHQGCKVHRRQCFIFAVKKRTKVKGKGWRRAKICLPLCRHRDIIFQCSAVVPVVRLFSYSLCDIFDMPVRPSAHTECALSLNFVRFLRVAKTQGMFFHQDVKSFLWSPTYVRISLNHILQNLAYLALHTLHTWVRGRYTVTLVWKEQIAKL